MIDLVYLVQDSALVQGRVSRREAQILVILAGCTGVLQPCTGPHLTFSPPVLKHLNTDFLLGLNLNTKTKKL